MSIQARWAGECPECGQWWKPGDLIKSERTEPGNLNKAVWQHVICPVDQDDPTALRAGEKVCDSCWLVHPKGKCEW